MRRRLHLKLSIGILLITVPLVFAKEVPNLTKENTSIAEKGVMNKCFHQNDPKKIIYSQFECPKDYLLVGETWKENTNITETPSSNQFLGTKPSPTSLPQNSYSKLPDDAPFADIVNAVYEKQSKGEKIDGYDVIKEMIEKKSPTELFNEGLRALMYRKEFLDSL